VLEQTKAGSAEEQLNRDNLVTEAYSPGMNIHLSSNHFLVPFCLVRFGNHTNNGITDNMTGV